MKMEEQMMKIEQKEIWIYIYIIKKEARGQTSPTEYVTKMTVTDAEDMIIKINISIK